MNQPLKMLAGASIVLLFMCGRHTAVRAVDVLSARAIVVGPNVRASSNLTEGTRNECWLTVSPTTPGLMVGVSQTAASEANRSMTGRSVTTMLSRNGGQTWREVRLPQMTGPNPFDPMTAAGPDNRMYVLYGYGGGSRDVSVSDLGQQRVNTLKVWSTTDGGYTWRGPTSIATPLSPDHPRIAVDWSDGPHRGRLYVVWNEISDTLLRGQYHIFLNYSDDGGATFSEPTLVATDGDGKLVATEPVILSDGTLLVTYYQYYWPLADKRNEHQPFYIVRSSDGGKTFESPEKIASVGSSAWRHLRRNFANAFTLPVIAADTGRKSPYRDHIYAVWDDASDGASSIWLIESTDKGRTWSERRRIDDTRRQGQNDPVDFRNTPVVAVNDAGVVAVAWYDRREDPSRRCWKEYFAASLDGGATWLPNTPVSTAPSCPPDTVEPTLQVWNAGPEFDDTSLTAAELEKMNASDQRAMAEEVAIQEAWKEANSGAQGSKLRASFDSGRSVWPGHYAGLSADATGVFHAFWADRRNGIQQIFTAPIAVGVQARMATPTTREAVVTDRVQLVGGPGKFDKATGTTTFELQVRNASDQPIYAPIRVRVTRLVPDGSFSRDDKAGGSREPAVSIVGADEGGAGIGAVWDFSKRLGMWDRLDPKTISETRKISLKTRVESGLDATVEFEVLGHVPK